MQTYVQYPPRKLQGESYTGPITLSNYERFQWVQRATEEGRRRPSDAQRQLTCGRGPGAISGAVSRLPERPDA